MDDMMADRREAVPGRVSDEVPEGAAPTRVLVVDDHPIWRDAVARDLTEAGFEVCASVGEGRQAVRIIASLRCEVAVADLHLPDLAGPEMIRGMLSRCPGLRILVLSASGEQQDVLDAVKAGASGYLLKSASSTELVDAARRTAAGDAVFTRDSPRWCWASTAGSPGTGHRSLTRPG